jgi:hypothetical protein
MDLLLKRACFAGGSNGELWYGAELICHSIELPWRNNQRGISCIAEGSYRIDKRYSARFKEHFILCHVPKRAVVLMHPANNALTQLRGCIAPVLEIVGEGRGCHSRLALQKLVALLYPVLEKGEVYLNIQSKI